MNTQTQAPTALRAFQGDASIQAARDELLRLLSNAPVVS